MSKSNNIRLDEFLISRGDFGDADEVLRAVIAGEVRVGDTYVTSPAVLVAPDADIFVKAHRQFVSRGGYKLEGALEAFNQDVHGMNCIDVGSSTGGFTDCLLQKGAASVTCIDVNYGQLAWELRRDSRVHVFERTNIRHVSPEAIGAPFDLIVVDVSFIGLATLAPIFVSLCYGKQSENKTVFIGLVKPQFESRQDESDHGIVRDESVRIRTVEEVCSALDEQGFEVMDTVKSSLTGAEGNIEYFVRALY